MPLRSTRFSLSQPPVSPTALLSTAAHRARPMASRRTERRKAGRERAHLRQGYLPTTYEEEFRDYHGPASGVISSVGGELQSERRNSSRLLTSKDYLERRDFNINDHLRNLHESTRLNPAETRLPSSTASNSVSDTRTDSADRLNHPNGPAVDAVKLEHSVSPSRFDQTNETPGHGLSAQLTIGIDELNKGIERKKFDFMTSNLDSIMEKVQAQKRKQATGDNTGLQFAKRQKPSDHFKEVSPTTAATIPEMSQPTSQLGFANPLRHDPRSHGTIGSPLVGSDIAVWLDDIQRGKVREDQDPPLLFSIKLLQNNAYLDVGVATMTSAFRAIYKWLKAAILLGRELDKLKDSWKKGNWKCLYTLVSIESMSWPKEGMDG
ncbi:hypothetical protein FB567DRAFT_177030 [Paraphoma chrysanthemicola]|uniref:Uncharacterized protein n=1 Tax=Paraphoma chrysanthemicola TaxID=798071 RepID=A0A8K0W4C3_9PLEO|nr:hypothetical protein FB567DRAFT_177030 [Paraphoma chrysanthemicola]